MREIYISEQAFLGIILAAAEVYRRECYGLLFGYSLPGKTIVEGAIAYQTADRKFAEVSLFVRQNKVIQRVIRQFPKHEYLGEFHSHPDYGGQQGEAGPGYDDFVGVSEAEIQLVIAINPRRRTVRWSTNRSGALSGTLGDHHYKIAGFQLRHVAANGRSGRRKGRRRVCPRLVRARVFCPYAVGLGLGRERHEATA